MTGYGSAGSRWMTERLSNERHPHYGADDDDDMDEQYNPSGKTSIIVFKLYFFNLNLKKKLYFNRQRRPDTAAGVCQ